jgi:hypothetical protein
MGNLLEAHQDLGVVESHGVTLTDDDEYNSGQDSKRGGEHMGGLIAAALSIKES